MGNLKQNSNIECPFCNPSKEDIIFENKLCYIIFDKYPVNKGHMLVIPFRHFDNYFDATLEEKLSIIELIYIAKEFLDKELKPDGYNIGVNVGEAAGQSVMHLHIHVIPRYNGDIENPKGGVRGVIPYKRIY